MSAAAELQRHARYIHDAHHVAVFLTEQRHGAGRDRILVRHLPRLDREIFPQLRVDFRLHGDQLLAFHRAVMAEIETQSLRRDHRSRLMDVGAQDLAQRGMHEMRRRVIALDVAPPGLVHLRDGRRRLERLAERADDRALAIDFLDLLNGELPPLTLQHTCVAHLPTRLGVKRILLQNDL